MAKLIGSDCTKGALEWQFRRYKAGGKLQAEAVKAGRDPKDVNVDVNPQGKPDGAKGSSGRGGNSIALHLNDGTTAPALDHRFRPIKKEALAMKAAIASNYGEGASGKAVSTYFERAKKDPQWNLANTIAENGAGSGSATKAKATPRKRAPKAKKNSSISDDEDTETFDTPSKTPLNKVASGRITKKATPRSASKKIANYAEPESEDEEDDEIIKGEPEGFEDIQYKRNGNGHSHSNGNGNGYAYAHHVDNSMHTDSYTGAVDDDNENAYYDAEEA